MVPLVLIICKSSGWCLLVDTSCDCEAARAGAYDQDVMGVHSGSVCGLLELSLVGVPDTGNGISRQ